MAVVSIKTPVPKIDSSRFDDSLPESYRSHRCCPGSTRPGETVPNTISDATLFLVTINNIA